MFPCEKCGACCRSIGTVAIAKDMALPNGICKFLNQQTNLCMQYETRPIFCNVDRFYEHLEEKFISRDEFYRRNKEICKLLQQKQAIEIKERRFE